MTKERTLRISALALSLLALFASGCGSSEQGPSGAKHPNYDRAFADAPGPMAELHTQEGELLGGGVGAYDRRLQLLGGYPVVVNVWASWCGPCRFEFPVLQKLSARYAKQVAFLGVNSKDSIDAAATFLREAPVPYPSYSDPDGKIADSIGASLGLPDTAFYDSGGKLVYLKQGPYAHDSELEADVRRYALSQ